MTRLAWTVGALLAATLILVITLAAGPSGLAYAALYVGALLPGLPIGFALFGRRHAAGWIAGAALGYFVTTIALWLVIAFAVPSVLTFIAGWLLALALTWASTRRVAAPFVPLPHWSSRDTAALLIVLLLVPAIAGPPFIRLGTADANGNRYYRAYFTADFVWHMAVTSELKKFAMPPRNMYMPHRPLHYYWAYYVFPAAVAGTAPGRLANIEADLKVNAIGTALLLISTMFVAAWTAVPHAVAAAAAVALATVASSAEGTLALLRLLQRGAPLAAVRNLNIDAISNWWFGGLRIDGIPRCFWWVPQHSTSYVLGLVALAVVNAAGSGARPAAFWAIAAALAGSVAFNPFVGALFAAVCCGALAVDALISPEPARRLARSLAVVPPVVAALAWCIGNRMVGGAPGMLELGLLGGARNAPIANLARSLGPALLPVLAGALAAPSIARARAMIAPALMLVVALVVMHLVRLRVDESWVGFRAGQLLLVVAPCLSAAAFAAARHWRRAAVALAIVVLIVALPTTAIDVYNAQDITNLSPGPGFPWTQVLDRSHDEAAAWVRQTIPEDATVQLDAVARGRTTWSLIPSFAERRMSAGLPRTLVDDPEYHERSERVRVMYATSNAREAWTIARSLRVNYIWTDEVERGAYPAGVAKFDRAPEYFALAYRNDEVSIYRVQ